MNTLTGGDSLFRVTPQGIDFVALNSPTPPKLTRGQKRYRDFFRSHGIAMADAGAGISHLIMTEQGVVVPGSVIALKDSHTQTMGAVGAFAASLAGGMLSLYAIGRY